MEFSTQKASNAYYYHTSNGYFRDAGGTVGYFDFYFSTKYEASGTFSVYGVVKSIRNFVKICLFINIKWLMVNK